MHVDVDGSCLLQPQFYSVRISVFDLTMVSYIHMYYDRWGTGCVQVLGLEMLLVYILSVTLTPDCNVYVGGRKSG